MARRITRINRVLIGGNSRNLGSHNILVTKRRGVSDTPQVVQLRAEIQADGSWNLIANWLAPSDTDLAITGYEIQQRQIQAPDTPFGDSQTVVPTTATYVNVPEGIYQVRVRSLYAGGPSMWVVSPSVNAFINLSFNWAGSPSFHTLAV